MLLEGYNLQHVEDALRTLPRGVGHVTFPVHCTMARVGSDAILKLLKADHRFTLTLWGEAMPADDEWMYSTPELSGRVFRDCAKPGVLSYTLTIVPLLFQQATRSLALTALGGAVALTRQKQEEGGQDSPPSAEAPRVAERVLSITNGRKATSEGAQQHAASGHEQGAPRDFASML